MRISRLKITNVKSFQDKVDIPFDPQFNILVGPNGGGKSNFLDFRYPADNFKKILFT